MTKLHATGKNSNIELLRALSMLMIVAYHYAIMGFYAEDIMYTANKSFVDIFGMGGKIGTDVFVMISGYYMVQSRFTLKKLLSLMGQLWFFTIGALLVFTLVNGFELLSFSLIKASLFPLLSSHYWFASYYVLLMLLSPFLNAMLHSLSKSQHAALALLLFTLCTVLPYFFSLSFAGGSLWLFVALYISAAWFRLYIEPSRKTANRSLLAAALLLLLCAGKILLSNRMAQQAMDEAKLIASTGFLSAYSPFAFIIAALLLLGFVCHSPRQDKAAYVLGGTSFGVYLFHANLIVNEYLYQDIFNTAAYADHPLLFLHAMCTVSIIYASGMLLELLRQKSFGKLWDRAVDTLCAVLPGKVKTR